MSKATLRDIVDGTPKGQKAVDKAIRKSIKDQEKMCKKAKNSPSNNKVSAAPIIIYRLRQWWAKRWGQCMRQKQGYSCKNRVCKGLEEH